MYSKFQVTYIQNICVVVIQEIRAAMFSATLLFCLHYGFHPASVYPLNKSSSLQIKHSVYLQSLNIIFWEHLYSGRKRYMTRPRQR